MRYALRTKIENRKSTQTKHTITIILDDRTSNEEDGDGASEQKKRK